MKFGIISAALPPSSSGQSIALYNLLKEINPNSYFLINTQNTNLLSYVITSKKQVNKDNLLKLNANCYYPHQEAFYFYTLFLVGQFFKILPLTNKYINRRVEAICTIIKNESCDAIIGCTSDLFSPPIAYYAAKKLGLPFYFYLFDWYSRQWYIRKWMHPNHKWFGTFYEKLLINNSSGVIVPNEFLYEEIFKLYGIRSKIIHNPINSSIYKNLSLKEKRKQNKDIQIVFTGALYDTNFDAFLNLINAIQKIKDLNVIINLYITNKLAKKIQKNLSVPFIVHHQPLSHELMPEIQKNADILFLPLSFEAERKDIIRTSAPGKMGDYLASGTPILVHAPQKSFLSWYFRKHNCGMVIDENDPSVLAKGIQTLCKDLDLQNNYVENAIKMAYSDFDPKNAKVQLLNVLSNQ